MPRRAHNVRRPWLRLGLWTAAVVVLALLGTQIARHLSPSSLLVPGTPSARAEAVISREFGSAIPVTVLLRGPASAIDRQGPRLASALRRQRGVVVMSPWDSAGSLRLLRPHPDTALLIAGFEGPSSDSQTAVATAERVVARTVQQPLGADVGGIAKLGIALQSESLAATRRAELLVAPFLVIILLLVFRSPLAAAIPLLMGAATVAAGRGLLVFATYLIPINSLAVAMASMMGLALGVDYALLMVSRFRQERETGADANAALAIATRAAGRTIVFAGGTLAAAMLAAAMVAPGELLSSVATGVIVSALFSVVLAISMMPALLVVMAPHLERWRLPGAGNSERLLSLVGGLIVRPWVAIPLIALPMLALAAPASALRMGPPDAGQLPASDPTRQGFETLRRAVGPGWTAPITVTATASNGVISTSARLSAISRWQRRVAREPGVAAVIGPQSLREAEAPFKAARRSYAATPRRLSGAKHGIAALSSGLERAGAGVAQLRGGLGGAAHGAARIAGSTGKAARGAESLDAGLARVGTGVQRLSTELDHGLQGAARLVPGQHGLNVGAVALASRLTTLGETLHSSLESIEAMNAHLHLWASSLHSLGVPTEMAAERVGSALRSLEAMSAARAEPSYPELLASLREAAGLIGAPNAPPDPQAAQPGGTAGSLAGGIGEIQAQLASFAESLSSMPERLEALAAAVRELQAGAGRLAAGASASEQGGRGLEAALRGLARGGRHLDREVEGAQQGSGRLAGGLGGLAAGAGRLSSRLESGQRQSARLAAGFARPQHPLTRFALFLNTYRHSYWQMRHRSPGAIDSGYLLLAALDGTVPHVRERIEHMIDLNRGGRTARMLIVPAAGPSTPATAQLISRLRKQLPGLARASHTEVAIGEGAQTLADYAAATRARTPLLIVVLSVVAIAMLTAVLRSLLLPIVAVALNLLTIVAAFGALKLLLGLGLLTGPQYVDVISAVGVMAVMFVLSIDYEVFLLTRVHEAWLEGGDHRRAIDHGLRRTAGVITGAAAIMSLVFCAFATAEVASLQQFGAGLAIAVVLDATVIRLVLLPAIMRALGPRAWWLPAWLERRLPHPRKSLAIGDSDLMS